MGKYRIADFNVEFTFHSKEFFDRRLAAYEYLFEQPDLTIESIVNNEIKEEIGKVLIQSKTFKQIVDSDGNIHQITYKNEEGFIAQKLTFNAKMNHCKIEMIDHKNKLLTLEEREYIATCQAYVRLLTHFDSVMFHASAISYKGEAILFSADSGTGKSTHTQLWKQVYGDDVVFINDDKPIVRQIAGQYYVYGTPWSGKTDLNNNLKIPLKALVMVERGLENHIERVPLSAVIKSVFANINIVKEESELTKKMLDIYSEILESTQLYRLQCTISVEAPKMVKAIIDEAKRN